MRFPAPILRAAAAAAAAVGLVALAPGVALAQPAGVSRTLQRFDFEERNFNVEDVPAHWQKVEGEGLPFYVNGRLSRDAARSGRYSFQLDLNGGSLLYRYPAGRIPVKTGAHYRVDAWVRTTPMPQARARVTAYFADVDGRALAATVRHSELYAAASEDDPWRRIGIEVTAVEPQAAFLVIELGLVQPALYRPSTLGERALFTQDIRGTAWFDDVAVSQVPRVTMATDRPGNVFPVDVPPTIRVTINDRFIDDLTAQLTIRDAAGRLVSQRTEQPDLRAARTVGEYGRQMTLTLPEQLAAGWYDVRLTMASQGQELGTERLAIVKLADRGRPVPPDDRFGVIATRLPAGAWGELPELLPLLGAGRVKLAVWRADEPAMTGGGDGVGAPFDEVVESLQRRRITPTACLIGLPPAVAEAVGGDSLADLLKADPAAWRPQLAYLVARHANHVDRWQLGDDGSDAFVTTPEMRQVYRLVHEEFRRLIRSPQLAVPWPAWYELDADAPPAVALAVPPSVLPHQVPLYVEGSGFAMQASGRARWMAPPAAPSAAAAPGSNDRPTASLTLLPLERERYGRDLQVRDFAQRFAYAAAAGAGRIDVPLPFDATVNDATGEVNRQPHELLLVQRTLALMLSNATFRGRVPIAENVEAFLFDREGQGVLMLWGRGDSAGDRDLSINLGPRPVRVDLWGNVAPLLASERTAAAAGVATPSSTGPSFAPGNKVRVNVGPTPIFIVGIDGEMMRLRSSVAWDNDRVESSFRPHVRRLRFANPYATAISGTVRLRGPAGWVLSPPTQTFSLNPGETFDREVTVEFPYNTFAGVKPVVVDFLLQGEADATFSVPVPLTLGLSDVGLQTIALREGDDVIVQQIITNYGARAIDYTAFAVFPGHARQERLVTNLGPGRTTLKKYRFAGVNAAGAAGAAGTPATRVRSGLKELEGTRILNDEVQVR